MKSGGKHGFALKSAPRLRQKIGNVAKLQTEKKEKRKFCSLNMLETIPKLQFALPGRVMGHHGGENREVANNI